MARQIGRDNRTFLFYELGLIRSPYPAEALRELERSHRDIAGSALARIERILAGKH